MVAYGPKFVAMIERWLFEKHSNVSHYMTSVLVDGFNSDMAAVQGLSTYIHDCI